MGLAKFINDRFLKQKIIFFMDSEAETLTYSESWASNKEFFEGVVEEVDLESGIIVLNIEDVGLLFINEHYVKSFWRPGFDYIKAIKTSLTNKMVSQRGK